MCIRDSLKVEVLLLPELRDGEATHGLVIAAILIVGVRVDVLGRDLGDVFAVVTALGNLERAGTRLGDARLYAAREVRDLRPGVVVVELPRHLPAAPLEQASDGIA